GGSGLAGGHGSGSAAAVLVRPAHGGVRRLDASRQYRPDARRHGEPRLPRTRERAPMNYNAALLHALAPGRPVSGEALGRELGVSRAAAWKAVQRLGALGLDIEALPGRGYRLAQPLSLLDADAIRAALPAGTSGRLTVLEVLAETGSTNSRVLAAGRPVGELVASLAEYQAAG